MGIKSEGTKKENTVMHDKMKDEETRIGRIIKLRSDNGYGFINNNSGASNIFFHAKSVIEPKFSELIEGMEVEYLLVETAKGLKAIGIVAV